jgi:glycosyltransferase involved in cell wall biosynthesis
MDICLLGYGLGLPGNGAAMYAQNLALGLTRRGHRVEVVTQPVGGLLKNGSYEVQTVGGKSLAPLGGPRFALSVLLLFARRQRRAQVHVVHSLSANPQLALLGSVVSRMAGVPHVHSALSANHSSNHFRFVDLLVYTSTDGRDGSCEALHIPPPIDVVRFRSAPAAEPGFSRDGFRVGFMGPPLRRKGLRPFVQAIPAVLASCPQVKFELAVDVSQVSLFRELREELRWLVTFIREHGLESHVRVRGEVDAASFLRSLDVLVFPLQTASGVLDPPLTIVEAMAAGRAVMSTQVGSIPGLLSGGEAGFLIERGREGDPCAYADALISLAACRERVAGVGQLAAERASAFDLDRIAARFEEHYVQLVS